MRRFLASSAGVGSVGRRAVPISDLVPHGSMMTHAADPRSGRELLTLRERMRAWRFYDHFRTDRDAPARLSRPGTRTFALASDGAGLAAAIQTVIENGDDLALSDAIADAFPGASIAIDESDGLFELRMKQHGLLRPLRDSELSGGTLRYLLLVAALMTPSPPPLIVLNEPETSLHPAAGADHRRDAFGGAGGPPARSRRRRARTGQGGKRNRRTGFACTNMGMALALTRPSLIRVRRFFSRNAPLISPAVSFPSRSLRLAEDECDVWSARKNPCPA